MTIHFLFKLTFITDSAVSLLLIIQRLRPKNKVLWITTVYSQKAHHTKLIFHLCNATKCLLIITAIVVF